MTERPQERWTDSDVCVAAIHAFRHAIETPRPYDYVLYRKRKSGSGALHTAGVTVRILQTRDIVHDNELYAWFPGEQYLLAAWGRHAQVDWERERFPIRIMPLEEARMSPVEPIYDDDGNEAGWRMRPATPKESDETQHTDRSNGPATDPQASQSPAAAAENPHADGNPGQAGHDLDGLDAENRQPESSLPTDQAGQKDETGQAESPARRTGKVTAKPKARLR